MSELIPCPFCGGEAISCEIEAHKHLFVDFPDYSGGGFVECTECDCAISGETREEAERKWNRRVNNA